jgi:hypothetical protein
LHGTGVPRPAGQMLPLSVRAAAVPERGLLRCLSVLPGAELAMECDVLIRSLAPWVKDAMRR